MVTMAARAGPPINWIFLGNYYEVASRLGHLDALIRNERRGTRLAWLVERVTLDLRVVASSPTVSVEIM